ncbi:MAG: hypothetical protein ACP5XB_09040 [Isosphaeraceae bacterium]
MATERWSNLSVLERGDLFFLYRPNEDRYEPGGLLDVRRFYMVLHPQGQERFRLIAIGKKKLPGAGDGPRRHWGFVDGVFQTALELRQAAAGLPALGDAGGENLRPAGEGVYALALHGNHTHLAYVLELPPSPGEVQEAFNIKPEGRFVIAVKNPQASSPPGVGLELDRQPDFPRELHARFGDRRWVSVDPPEFLDYEGCEIVLIGGKDDLGEDLGINLKAHPEDEETAEIFQDLHMERTERTIKPLFEGVWE